MRLRIEDVIADEETGRTRPVHAMPLGIALMALGGAMNIGDVDFKTGRYLVSECVACHGSGTKPSPIPHIFGMAEPTFIGLVTAYRDKNLPNPVMQNIASRLQDEQIAALAAYFARSKLSQEAKP